MNDTPTPSTSKPAGYPERLGLTVDRSLGTRTIEVYR
jgi:hypothetical protein